MSSEIWSCFAAVEVVVEVDVEEDEDADEALEPAEVREVSKQYKARLGHVRTLRS